MRLITEALFQDIRSDIRSGKDINMEKLDQYLMKIDIDQGYDICSDYYDVTLLDYAAIHNNRATTESCVLRNKLSGVLPV